MKLLDALFNWLQIKVVADARPDDRAAQETKSFFEEILADDHHVEIVEVTSDQTMYSVRYRENKDLIKTQMYDRETVEQLLEAIENEPKYGQ